MYAGIHSLSGAFSWAGNSMTSTPDSTIKVTNIVACGEGKVCISIELVVDAHRLVDVSGQMLSVAAKGVSTSKKKR